MNAPRMSLSLILFCLLGVLVMLAAPQQTTVALFKFTLVIGAGVAGYYLDRELFPYARPDIFLATQPSGDPAPIAGRELAFAAAMLRRAIVVVGAMIAIGLGA